MGTKKDFASLFNGLEDELELLPTRFELRDFNLMITSQRTMDKIYTKFKKIDSGSLSAKPHSNFWADLRTLGIAHKMSDNINQFGKATLDYFNIESDNFKREHFILSNIRKKSYDIPSEVKQTYLRKLSNLYDYLKLIPPLNKKKNSILKNERKLFFTECLNTFPKALQRYFQLPKDRQKALDDLGETDFKNLFDGRITNEKNLSKVGIRFQNRIRAFDRRTNFIKSVILSEYEEKLEKNTSGKVGLKKLSSFKKILNQELLNEIISNSKELQVIKLKQRKPYVTSVSREMDRISKIRTTKRLSDRLKNYTKEQLDDLLKKWDDVVRSKPRKKMKGIVSRIKRNDIIPKILKEKYDYKCQFCGLQIPKKNGGFYIENAHIIPLNKGGKDTRDNMIIVCPNHHKMIDYGDFTIISMATEKLVCSLYGKKLEIPL